MRPAWMDELDRDDLCRYVMMRCGLEKYDEEMATRYKQDLKREVERIRNGYQHRGEPQDIARAARRAELLKIAMKGSPDFAEAAKGVPYLTS